MASFHMFGFRVAVCIGARGLINLTDLGLRALRELWL